MNQDRDYTGIYLILGLAAIIGGASLTMRDNDTVLSVFGGIALVIIGIRIVWDVIWR